jgi:hypothetical protein
MESAPRYQFSVYLLPQNPPLYSGRTRGSGIILIFSESSASSRHRVRSFRCVLLGHNTLPQGSPDPSPRERMRWCPVGAAPRGRPMPFVGATPCGCPMSCVGATPCGCPMSCVGATPRGCRSSFGRAWGLRGQESGGRGGPERQRTSAFIRVHLRLRVGRVCPDEGMGSHLPDPTMFGINQDDRFLVGTRPAGPPRMADSARHPQAWRTLPQPADSPTCRTDSQQAQQHCSWQRNWTGTGRVRGPFLEAGAALIPRLAAECRIQVDVLPRAGEK